MNKRINVTEIFGSNVFDKKTMQERLPKKIYDELQRTIERGAELDKHVAEIVANAYEGLGN